MFKSVSILPTIACVALVFGASSALEAYSFRASGASESSEAFTFYLNYLKTAAAAETVSDVAPFMPSWWRSRYESADSDTQRGAVERLGKLAQDLQELTLEKEEPVDGGGVRLHLTARDQNDASMRGEVLILPESGSLVVEESKWATAQ
jgi:hypothetical protein